MPDTKPDAEPAVKDKFQKFQNRLIALLKRQDLPRFPKPTEELATAAKQASDAVAAALEAMRLQTERVRLFVITSRPWQGLSISRSYPRPAAEACFPAARTPCPQKCNLYTTSSKLCALSSTRQREKRFK